MPTSLEDTRTIDIPSSSPVLPYVTVQYISTLRDVHSEVLHESRPHFPDAPSYFVAISYREDLVYAPSNRFGGPSNLRLLKIK